MSSPFVVGDGPNDHEMNTLRTDTEQRLPAPLTRKSCPLGFDRHPLTLVTGDSDDTDDSVPAADELIEGLEKGLKGYHVQMIALGSAIGTGLFLGSGEGLAVAGPIPLLCAFVLVGITLCPTIFALGEMATLFPVPGGFFEHCRMYTDEAWAGAMGWK